MRATRRYFFHFFLFATTTTPTTTGALYYYYYYYVYGMCMCYYVKSMKKVYNIYVIFFQEELCCSNVQTHTMRPIKWMSNKRRKNNIIIINDPQWRGMRVCECVSARWWAALLGRTTYYWKVKFQGSLAISDPGSQYARARVCVTRLPVYYKCTRSVYKYSTILFFLS